MRIARDGTVTPLASPAALPDVPGSITEVETTAEDGARVRGLAAAARRSVGLPQPAPLLLWIHGGPLNSWNAWSWRWNPLLAVARGYAVLLPDPGALDRATASSSSPAAGTAGAASPSPT